MVRRKADAAARWVKSVSADDDHLAPEEPPALAVGLPMASTPAEAAWLAAFQRDEGLTIAESTRPFGERLATKPVEPDGRIATVIGRLGLEEYKAAARAKQIDAQGNLFVKRSVERETSVRTRQGRHSRLSVPLTLEEFRTTEEQWRQADANARTLRAQSAARRAESRSRAASPTARRYELQPGFELPTDAREYDEWTGEWYELYGGEQSDDDPELLDWDDPDFFENFEFDEYDDLADRLAYWVTSDEEDRARELAYGLPEGSLTLDEWSWREKFFCDQEDEAGADEEPAESDTGTEQTGAETVVALDAGQHGRCQNPNGCDQPTKPRGTRCPACYKYRSAHRGEERPLRLLNRQRRRRAT